MADEATANLPATTTSVAAGAPQPATVAVAPAPSAAEQWKPLVRQILLIVGMAGVVAVGVVTYLWGAGPSMKTLYADVTEQEAGEITKQLEGMNIEYKIDRSTGAILVPSSDVHSIRMKLAGQGLPRGGGQGLAMLNQDQSLGTSQFIEGARYHHAIEHELAKSISSLEAVRKARVHLALPKRSAFLREQSTHKASVIVDLYPGRFIGNSQVQSILHMVASSIPHLEPSNVTVVDQTGKLLSDPDDDPMGLDISGKQFAYKQSVEQVYTGRIEKLLEPIVGFGRVRAEVNTEMDFSMSESTQEFFDPEKTVIRSEQATEDSRAAPGSAAEGVPGTLTNQPPPAGVIAGEQVQQTNGLGNAQKNISKTETRNYEVGKIISHTRQPVGLINKISVAVLIDEKEQVAEDGTVSTVPMTAEEITQLTNLVKEVVGYNEERGDSVQVVNAAFMRIAEVEAIETPFYEQGWVQNLGKQLISAIVILILVFTVLRPMIYGVFGRTVVRGSIGGALKELELSGAAAAQSAGMMMVPVEDDDDEAEAKALAKKRKKRKQRESIDPEDIIDLQDNPEFEARLEMAKKFAREDPGLVTNVVRGWLAEE